jgi:putative drug exporter of the RND superfamily
MANALHRLGRFAVRRRRLVLGSWIVALVAAVGLVVGSGGAFSDSFEVPGVESQAAYDLLAERFPEHAGARAQVVVHVDEGALDEPERAAVMTAVLDEVAALEHVSGPPVLLLAPEGSPSAGRTGLAEVGYDLDVTELGTAALHDLEAAVAPLADAGIEVAVGGELAQYAEQPETKTAEMVGVLAATVILLLAFGSVIAMGLPIGIALFGLATGTTLVLLLSTLIDIPTTAPTVSTMIGIGVGIDYALFVVTRHRQHLAEGMTVEEAAGRANATAGQAVIFAGGTVVIAICGLALAGIPMIAAMGYAAAVVVSTMVLASITLLPALFGFAGLRLERTSLPWVRRREARQAERAARLRRLGAAAPRTGWQRWGDHVTARPWRYLLGGTTALLLLAAPVLDMRLGQTDAGNAAPGSSLRIAYDRVAEGFGPGVNGRLLVAVDLAGASGPDVLGALAAEIAQDPGVIGTIPVPNAAGDAGLVVVTPASAPQSEATSDLVHRLRDRTIPAALDGTGADAYVGGLTATFIDLADRVGERLPWFIGAVVGLSFVLLMMVFRSVLVPLKAALLNLLSIGAAYGVVVAVFQWGWGKDLIGLQETVPIVAFVPMFMFAILFGLSMDYEVFLLSRVREEYVSGADNTTSVINGIATTARVITSAALIMIAVFSGFVLGADPIVKMMGLGLATAVLVDATIVRCVLVPASMRLMGDANWWLPGWLDRVLPSLDIEGATGLPEPEYRTPSHPVHADLTPESAPEPEPALA